MRRKTLIRLLSSIRKKYGAVNSGTVVYLTGKKRNDTQTICFHIGKSTFLKNGIIGKAGQGGSRGRDEPGNLYTY